VLDADRRARAIRPAVVLRCPIYNCVYKDLSLTDRI
jgi:hypothetical protein